MIAHRTRFNSGDSNTSGVSSADSIMNRTTLGELHQTLSPIPSSSNLLDYKKSAEDKFRRTSLTGAPIRDHNLLTPQDLQGYKKLRAIRRNLRPTWSESAADDLSNIYENEALSNKSNRLDKIITDPKKKSKRTLERQFSLNIAG